MELEEIKNIDRNIKAHQGQDIDFITKTPPWLLRSGMTLLFIVLVAVIVFTNFFKYPEKIVGSGIVTSDIPPISLLSNTTGYIEDILVPNESYVTKGTVIATIHQNANTDDMQRIQSWVTELIDHTNFATYLDQHAVPIKLQLGNLQNAYTSLLNKYEEYKIISQNQIHLHQIETIKDEIKNLHTLNQSLAQEENLFLAELTIDKKQLSRSEAMHDDRLISTVDFENTQKGHIAQQRTYESMANRRLQNQVRITQLQYEQAQITKQRTDQINTLHSQIREQATALYNDLITWQVTYAVIAPIDGQVYLPNTIKKFLPVNTGAHIAHILSKDAAQKYATIKVPSQNFGKIALGQKALVKFEPYPYKEYGLYTSQVSYKDLLPTTNEDKTITYEIKVPLPDTILTDYRHLIPYQPSTPCTVEIITKDRSLFQRLVEQLTSQFNSK